MITLSIKEIKLAIAGLKALRSAGNPSADERSRIQRLVDRLELVSGLRTTSRSFRELLKDG